MKKLCSGLSRSYMAIMIILLYLPIIYIFVFAFNDSNSMSQWEGFSFRWFETVFQNRDMVNSIYTTFFIALAATGISAILGTVSAIGLSNSGKLLRGVVEQTNNLPVMNPDIVTAMGLLLLFTTFGVAKGYGTILLAHVMFCTPYVMLSVMPKLRTMDPNLMDAALDLGATPFYALLKVILPQIKSGIISGAMIAFAMSFDDFVITDFVKGAGINNISTMVYTMKRKNPSIYAMTTIVVLCITVMLIIINVAPLLKKAGKKGEDNA